MSIKAAFTFRGERVSPQFVIYKADLDLAPKKALFGDIINQLIKEMLEGLREGVKAPTFEVQLDTGALMPSSPSTINLASKAYISLIEKQRKLNEIPYLNEARELFVEANMEVKKALYVMAKYLGNELMSKVLAQLYAEYLVGKSQQDVAKILGHENIPPEEKLTNEEMKRVRNLMMTKGD